MTREVRLDDGKYGQMVFRTQQNRKNQVLGWLRRNFCSLDDGTEVRFPQTWRVIWEIPVPSSTVEDAPCPYDRSVDGLCVLA